MFKYMDDAERIELSHHLADYLIDQGIATAEQINRNQNFSCPSVSHNDDTPSAHYYEDEKCPQVYCFGCGGAWNIFTLVGEREGLTSFRDQIERVRELYARERSADREETQPRRITPKEPKRREMSEQEKEAAEKYIRQCQADIGKTSYWKKRGFTEDFVRESGLGYDVDERRLVIPTDKGYTARAVMDNAPLRYKNPRGIPVSLLGAEELQKEGTVFVVEGAIDALALRQAGLRSIGLNGVSNARHLARLAKDNGAAAHVVVTLDGDEAGHKAGIKLAQALKEAGVSSELRLDAWGEHKDPGEWLEKKGAEALRQRVAETLAKENDLPAAEKEAEDEKLYKDMVERLKKKRPEHLTEDLMTYWNAVTDELRNTMISLQASRNMCKVLNLWSVAIERASKEFGIEEKDLSVIRRDLSELQKESKKNVEKWNLIAKTTMKLEEFTSSMINAVVKKREQNPLFKLPEVQHAITVEEAFKEPPKKKPEVIYFAMLRQMAMEKQGIMASEADTVIIERLKARNRDKMEIVKCLACSPTLRNLPEGRKMDWSRKMTDKVLVGQEEKRGNAR